MRSLLQHPILQGAISGALGGLVVDINAYLAWAKARDGMIYDVRVALSRIVQGAVSGALAAAGLGGLGALA